MKTLVATGFLGASLCLKAQNPVVRLEFDAASVKVDMQPVGPGSVGLHGGPGTDDPSRIVWRGLPLLGLINQAYDVDGARVIGRTPDLEGDRFIVTATFPPATTQEQFRTMMQNLLAERFHLALHHETRELAGYEVTLAPGEPRFRKWTRDPNVRAQSGNHLEEGQSGFEMKRMPPPRDAKRTPPLIHIVSRQSLSEFVTSLPLLWHMSEVVHADADPDRAVPRGPALGADPPPRFVDKTGLNGEYELVFDFEGAMFRGLYSASGPTLREVLEKQLGLKVSKLKRIPTDVLVIDHVDRIPTEN